MIFRGVVKLVHGYDFIKETLSSKGLPQFLWISVPIGEIITLICLLLGIFTRISSLLIIITMLMTFYLIHGINAFSISQTGGLKVELNLLYLFSYVAIFFSLSGKYSLYKENKYILI